MGMNDCVWSGRGITGVDARMGVQGGGAVEAFAAHFALKCVVLCECCEPEMGGLFWQNKPGGASLQYG